MMERTNAALGDPLTVAEGTPPRRASCRIALATVAVAVALAACGVRGDPRLPEGVHDTMPLERQYPSAEVPPPAAEPEPQ
jgi:hypothetical protein